MNVLIGCNTDPGHNYTALYVPDPEILFHRLSFPKAFGEQCVPPGGSSIMAEITTNEGDGIWEMSDDALIESCAPMPSSCSSSRPARIDVSAIQYNTCEPSSTTSEVTPLC